MSGRLRTNLRAVPVPLWLLLAVTLVLSSAWLVVMPPFQGPDENSHFSYTQRMVETRSIPWFITGDPPPDGKPSSSSELGVAEHESGEQALAGNIGSRANWTELDEQLWREQNSGLSGGAKADGGFTSAMRYPPLYYFYTAVPYAALSEASIFDRLFAMRLLGIPLALGTVVFAWLIAGEVFRRRRWLQVTAAGVVALNPQLLHLATVANPDILLAFLGSAVLYLTVVMLQRGCTRGRAAWMVALSIACGLTHPRGLAICAAGFVAIAVALWRQTRPHARRTQWIVRAGTVATGLLGALALAVIAAGSTSMPDIRQFGSYLWQFYLPRLSFMDPSIRSDWGARQAFVDRFFGTYGQLDAVLPVDVLDLFAIGVLIGLAMLVVSLVVQWRAVRRHADIILTLGFAAAFYVVLMHARAYQAMQADPLDPVLTGRYLLPLMVLMGLAVATVVRAFPRATGTVAASAALSLAALIQFAALGVVVIRFYG